MMKRGWVRDVSIDIGVTLILWYDNNNDIRKMVILKHINKSLMCDKNKNTLIIVEMNDCTRVRCFYQEEQGEILLNF